jgi:chromosome segregation ATPase
LEGQPNGNDVKLEGFASSAAAVKNEVETLRASISSVAEDQANLKDLLDRLGEHHKRVKARFHNCLHDKLRYDALARLDEQVQSLRSGALSLHNDVDALKVQSEEQNGEIDTLACKVHSLERDVTNMEWQHKQQLRKFAEWNDSINERLDRIEEDSRFT